MEVAYELTKIDKENDGIKFTLTMKSNGYLAVGLGSGMNNVDMVMCNKDATTNKPKCTDLWSTTTSTPKTDVTQDITLIEAESFVNDKDRKFVFTRKLDTGDTNEDTILVSGKTYNFYKAWGESDSFV